MSLLASSAHLMQKQERHLLCAAPAEADAFELLSEVVVRLTFQLEEGVVLNGSRYVGSIHMVLGDHMGQVEAAGIVSPSGMYPSR
jgi:hypothetical protein